MNSAAAEIDVHDRLIREAFIEPIRTVVVVDDDYPTLDTLAAKELGNTHGWSDKKSENIPRVRNLFSFARNRERPWIIDIHDANGVGSLQSGRQAASHLHESDLLILDYHLQGDSGGGDAAISILRDLALGDYFNLVIVHTKGNSGDHLSVLREIALALTSPIQLLSAEEMGSANSMLDEWEELDDGAVSRLQEEVSTDCYLELRGHKAFNISAFLQRPEGQRVLEIWKKRPEEIQIDSKLLANWLLHMKQEQIQKQLSSIDLGNVQVGRKDGVNWILADKLFVTVLPKTCEPDEFEAKLLDAIRASFPSPHRLLLAKMRAEIDKQGLSAEAAILGNRYLQAEWLGDFLNPNPTDATAVVYSTVSRHWEALGDQLHQSVGGFTKQLHDHFSTLGVGDVMARCGLNKNDIGTPEALRRFNCYASTKPFDRGHLTTGHVFKFQPPEEDAQYWICLSPACDMVPRQEKIDGNLPFIAVRLHRFTDERPIKNAAKNVFLFIDIEGEIQTFSIHKDGVAENPDWQQMLVRSGGRFSEGNCLKLCSVIDTGEELKLELFEGNVVAQLRSEYALNLLQRIGTILSRPGLGMNFKQRS